MDFHRYVQFWHYEVWILNNETEHSSSFWLLSTTQNVQCAAEKRATTKQLINSNTLFR
jgi:predicted RNA-binding protein YlxR (DUF448 family)